jgi:hypothetical protein
MNKIKKSEIPAALKVWTDNMDDIWLIKYIRSLGYTLLEFIDLAEKDEYIRTALAFAIDSIFEKVIYYTASGNFNTELADFIVTIYVKTFKPITTKGITKKSYPDNDFKPDNKKKSTKYLYEKH